MCVESQRPIIQGTGSFKKWLPQAAQRCVWGNRSDKRSQKYFTLCVTIPARPVPVPCPPKAQRSGAGHGSLSKWSGVSWPPRLTVSIRILTRRPSKHGAPDGLVGLRKARSISASVCPNGCPKYTTNPWQHNSEKICWATFKKSVSKTSFKNKS